jgi:hypothetical protein
MPTKPDLADEVFGLEEAAKFIRMSPEWLERSDIPRARLGRRIVFLKSQLLAYVTKHLTHRIEDEEHAIQKRETLSDLRRLANRI